ncbi:biosynthetic-type acetolactate synthase large subunit [Paenibacillus cymbidii]|uniref:biosynthetic-type acetolactate synthase large subunit n=1 Tax=Paenibacillus cymbidii TaxID=1639034 RepID=UPI00107FF407|nr:biosynthetic-type acetolactate synthase large subunit [Paenibacillus cymbidii]
MSTTASAVSGSELLLRCLLREGVDCVFGYPGGNVLYVYDAMYNNAGFRHILTRHEQGAIHAADGYARATGRVGVCIATSGPGATNLVTGIATAHMDSVPLVVITGNVPTALAGSDAFQEADIVGITMPITKHSYYVRSAADLPRIVRDAFRIASTGRPGPVLIDIPKDVSNQSVAWSDNWLPGAGCEAEAKAEPDPDPLAIARMTDAIAAAKRPLLLVGGGIIASGAAKELLAFAEAARIPVVTTLLGLGGFPSGHELWVGMPGLHGAYAANKALQKCDVLIAAGARFDDRVTMKVSGFAPQVRTIVHIDIDAAEIGKIVPAAIACVGDVKMVLRAALPLVRPADSAQWLDEIAADARLFPLLRESDRAAGDEDPIKPARFIDMISESTRGEAIVTTDVGQHQMWAAQFYRFSRPRSFLTSGGLGTMGFGLPSAIGAQFGCPDRLVVSINGDGGIQMCAQELAVCALYRLPVKIVVMNNEVLGMVRQQQELLYDNRLSQIELAGSPDFVKLAEAYGIKGVRARTQQEARLVWQEALQTPGPVLIECVIGREENVYPMVRVGYTLDDMILGEPT